MQSAPAFDDHRRSERSLLADCIHCGFCLPACPTYSLFGEEMDSPRGRIELMRLGVDGAAPVDSTVHHLDLCLGCMACVTACPSGVRYGELLGATRQRIERQITRRPAERAVRGAIFALFPHRRRLRPLVAALALYRRSGLPRLVALPAISRWLPPLVRQLDELAPPPAAGPPAPALAAAHGERRRRVGLVRGCVQSAFFADVTAASSRLLAAAGCDVVAPLAQGCCGALSLHTGREAEAQRFARALIDAFDGLAVEHLVVDAAGCGSVLKEYGELLAGDPHYARRAAALAASVRDLSEELAELAPPPAPSPATRPARPPATASAVPLRIAYHDACHLAHAQGITSEPRQLIAELPGVELVELDDPYCCGSAGVYNLLQVEPARRLGERKAASVRRARPDLVVTANPGCLMQIDASLRRAGTPLPVVHLATLLDAARGGELGRLVTADPAASTRPAAQPSRGERRLGRRDSRRTRPPVGWRRG